MRFYKSTSKLISNYRKKANLTQEELSKALGFKNGKFIENVERELCGIPLKTLRRIIDILEIPPEELISAISNDKISELKRYIYGYTSCI